MSCDTEMLNNGKDLKLSIITILNYVDFIICLKPIKLNNNVNNNY